MTKTMEFLFLVLYVGISLTLAVTWKTAMQLLVFLQECTIFVVLRPDLVSAISDWYGCIHSKC